MRPGALLEVLRTHAAELLPNILAGSLCLAGFAVAAVVARMGVRGLLGHAQIDQAVVRLASQVAFYTLLVLGLITGLGTLGVNISALVASPGLGGFALGFALRDAVSSAVAVTLILIYRPFRVGQQISVIGLQGTVREINLRYTVLEAEETQQLVPNQLLFTNAVKVF